MHYPQKETPTGLAAGESKEKNTSGAIVGQLCTADKRAAKQTAQAEALATAEAKRFATLAALAGQSLQQTSMGYLLSRWTYSKHCADLDTVESLLGRMEGLSVKPGEVAA